LKPILVSGSAQEAEVLGGALAEGGDERWVRVLPGRPPTAAELEDAALVVHVVARARVSDAEADAFRLAARRNVPVVCILVGAEPEAVLRVPYVLATDVIAVPPGKALAIGTVIEHIAAKLGEKAYALAGKLPALRREIAERIVEQFARQNAVLGAAVFIPGADLPVMTLNQIRMVLRLAGAYGVEIDRERAIEILGVVAAGLSFRAVARQLVALVPVGGWAVKGGIGYAGTKAIGEAAIRYFEAGGLRAAAESVRSRS
jgi:uncharacterized protein (DUF697 family)